MNPDKWRQFSIGQLADMAARLSGLDSGEWLLRGRIEICQYLEWSSIRKRSDAVI